MESVQRPLGTDELRGSTIRGIRTTTYTTRCRTASRRSSIHQRETSKQLLFQPHPSATIVICSNAQQALLRLSLQRVTNDAAATDSRRMIAMSAHYNAAPSRLASESISGQYCHFASRIVQVVRFRIGGNPLDKVGASQSTTPTLLPTRTNARQDARHHHDLTLADNSIRNDVCPCDTGLNRSWAARRGSGSNYDSRSIDRMSIWQISTTSTCARLRLKSYLNDSRWIGCNLSVLPEYAGLPTWYQPY